MIAYQNLRLRLRPMAKGQSFSGPNIWLRPNIWLWPKVKIVPTVQHCSTSAPTTTTVGPTTTTEVRPGMNLCDPLMPTLMKKNGYEINMVICEANEICQPLSSNGELAKVGYVVFSSF